MNQSTTMLHAVRSRAEAVDADLSASTFRNVNLAGSVFEDVNLSNTTVRNASLAGAVIEGSDVSGVRITRANLTNVAIKDSTLEGMTIDGILVTELPDAYRKVRAQAI